MHTDAPLIVIAYDGSPDAELALHWAINAAELNKSLLKVVVVADPPERIAPKFEEQARRWTTAVTSAASAAVSEVSVNTEVVLERGDTLEILLGLSETAALVVLGSRGHGLWDAPWIGSVSHHLVGRASCPVAVVRPARHPSAHQILVGIDGTPASVRALHLAAERADATGEDVLAVHAYQHFSLAAGGRTGVQAIDIDTGVEDAAERFAAELVAGVRTEYPDVKLRSVAVLGRAGSVLADLAGESSLVVVGSRGRSPLQGLVLGSVSSDVLHNAQCPVLVVR